MSRLVFFFLFLFSLAAGAQAILIEEGDLDVFETSNTGPSKTIQPLSQRSEMTLNRRLYQNTEELRSHRRVGVGTSLLGQQGLYGAMIELNFSPTTSFLTGFGGGPGYNSFTFQWKHLFLGQKFSPYLGLGYSRWSGTGGSLGSSNPTVLSSKYLNEAEKKSGTFAVNLLNPYLGMQYHQLDGQYAGLSFFGEIVLLNEMMNLAPTPTAAIGGMFYF